MVTENTGTEEYQTRWIIDTNWYEQANRSFFNLAEQSLCPSCREKLENKKKVTRTDILRAIGSCCSKAPDYIPEKLPIMESLFRLLLANGNRPLTTEELYRQLCFYRDEEFHADSPRILSLERLLSHDQWYGFKPVSKPENTDS
jgi:hypothetical protein